MVKKIESEHLKEPSNPFNKFFNQRKLELIKQGIQQDQCASIISKEWQALPQTTKKTLEQQYRKEKHNYDQRIKQIVVSDDEEQDNAKTQKKLPVKKIIKQKSPSSNRSDILFSKQQVNTQNSSTTTFSTAEDSYEEYLENLKTEVRQCGSKSTSNNFISPPKLPSNAYLRFSVERFSQFRQKSKDGKLKEDQNATQIKKEWAALPKAKKQEYLDDYKDDIQYYNKIKQEYDNLNKPIKKPVTPFFKFFKKNLPFYKNSFKNLNQNELAVQLSIDWKTMTPSSKREYELEYEQEKKVFAVQREEIVQQDNWVVSEEFMVKKSEYEQEISNRLQQYANRKQTYTPPLIKNSITKIVLSKNSTPKNPTNSKQNSAPKIEILNKLPNRKPDSILKSKSPSITPNKKQARKVSQDQLIQVVISEEESDDKKGDKKSVKQRQNYQKESSKKIQDVAPVAKKEATPHKSSVKKSTPKYNLAERELEQIMALQTIDNDNQYLCKWHGLPTEHNSWVRAQELIPKYQQQVDEANIIFNDAENKIDEHDYKSQRKTRSIIAQKVTKVIKKQKNNSPKQIKIPQMTHGPKKIIKRYKKESPQFRI